MNGSGSGSDLGRAPLRIVSLVPSLTESVIALGLTPIACTRFCEQPALAHVGGTKDPDTDAIVALQPDVVLMDREENRREDASALVDSGIDVWATHVTSVADVAPMLFDLRIRLGLDAAADLGGAPPAVPRTASAKAFIAIWRRPWMTISASTYGSSLLASVGIGNVFAEDATTYPTVTLDDVVARSPQFVLLPSEPYPFRQRHVEELAEAVPGADVRLIDGQDLFWWGARTAAATARLAHALATKSP